MTQTQTTEGIRYGSTVSVDVPDLATGETVTITYENFTMQSQATPRDKPIKITGKFSPSSGGLKEAGTVEIDVTQVQDGYGEGDNKGYSGKCSDRQGRQ